MARLCIIYALSDPRLERVFENVRYVGKTERPLRFRLSGHLCRKNLAHKAQWIRSLESDGVVPAIWPLAFCSTENWQEIEKRWIAQLRPISRLTNVLSGGGGDVVWTEERRRVISESKKRKPRAPFSQLHRERIRLAAIGRKATPESIAKRVKALKGKKRSPEICQKFRELALARGPLGPMAESHKSKIAKAHLGILVPEYAKRKIAEANGIPIVCKNTGRVFCSSAEAARSIGVAAITIARAAKSGRTIKGLDWQYAKPTTCQEQL